MPTFQPHPRICRPFPLPAWTLVAAILVGCSPATEPAAPSKPAPKETAGADDHAHDGASHDHPETLAEGLAELEGVLKDVAARVASGAHDEADDAIHEAGHLVDDVRGLVDAAPALAAEAKEEVKKALDEVFAAVEELHEPFHADAPKKEDVTKAYEAVRERLEAALKTLRDRVGGTTKEEK